MDGHGRRRAALLSGTARAAAVLAAAASVWALALSAGGGFDVTLGGLHIRSSDPLRPLFLAFLACAVHLVAAGAPARDAWFRTASHVSQRALVAGLAVTTFGAALACSTTVAGGADAYGYVSQADLWIERNLRVEQTWVASFPWPDAAATASPLGYKPTDDSPSTIVPTYSPGLPLLMAGAKRLAGHGAMFWIVPLCAAIVVVATYGVGRRLGSPVSGLAGAWLTITSAPFVFTSLLPWSDVPATAGWTAAIYFALGRTWRTAAAAGLATAMAILIRPNLVWAAAILALWILARPAHDNVPTRAGALLHAAIYAVIASAGIVSVMLTYAHLFGSPFESGYGRFGDNFAASRVPSNLARYAGWLLDTRGVPVVLGTAALLVPFRRAWPQVRDRRALLPLAAFVTGLWVMYCSYIVLEGWLNLRFLLPMYPVAAVATGSLVVAFGRNAAAGASLALIGLVAGFGVFAQYAVVLKSGTLGLSRTERRYVIAGKLTREVTDANSAIFSMEHSGSARYYAGRATLRYDILDPVWLDRAVRWLDARGVRSYLLVDERELPAFRRRFAGQETARFADVPPVFRLEGLGGVMLFSLSRENDQPTRVIVASTAGTRSVRPAPYPVLNLK